MRHHSPRSRRPIPDAARAGRRPPRRAGRNLRRRGEMPMSAGAEADAGRGLHWTAGDCLKAPADCPHADVQAGPLVGAAFEHVTNRVALSTRWSPALAQQKVKRRAVEGLGILVQPGVRQVLEDDPLASMDPAADSFGKSRRADEVMSSNADQTRNPNLDSEPRSRHGSWPPRSGPGTPPAAEPVGHARSPPACRRTPVGRRTSRA